MRFEHTHCKLQLFPIPVSLCIFLALWPVTDSSFNMMAEGGRCHYSLKKFVEEHLQCSICHDLYKDPKILTCLHSFCRECLEKYLFQCFSLNVICPVCRKQTTVPGFSIRNLPADFKLVGMVEAVTKEPLQEVPTCMKHAGKICCGFCYTCNQLICFLCLKNSHNTHATGEVGEVTESLKQLVTEQTITNEKLLKDTVEAQETVSKMEEDCRATLADIRESVEDRAKKEIARVIAAKQRIMDKLNKIQNEREKLLEDATVKLNSAERDLRKMIKDSKAAVKINNDYDFLRKYVELKDDISAHHPIPDIDHITPLSVEFRPSGTTPAEVDLGELDDGTVIPYDDDDDDYDNDDGRVDDKDNDSDDLCRLCGHTVILKDDDDKDDAMYEDKYSMDTYKNAKKRKENWLGSEAHFPKRNPRRSARHQGKKSGAL